MLASCFVPWREGERGRFMNRQCCIGKMPSLGRHCIVIEYQYVYLAV